jgi:hypothetical protein
MVVGEAGGSACVPHRHPDRLPDRPWEDVPCGRAVVGRAGVENLNYQPRGHPRPTHRQALAALERAVLEGTLRHRGDPAVLQQLLAAACDRFDNGDVRRLRKLDRTRPIDAAIALALAVQGATIEQPSSVYDTRGLIVV